MEPFNDRGAYNHLVHFLNNRYGWSELKADLKSMNKRRASAPGASRCLRARWVMPVIASSVPLPCFYANCCGFNSGPTSAFSFVTMYFSKHFMTIEVNASGLWSLFPMGQDFFGLGIMVEFFQNGREFM